MDEDSAAGRMSYHVLGLADSVEFAKAEALASLLQASLPLISCEAQPVLRSDWQAEYAAICAENGFTPEEALQPIVWTGTRVLVGDLQAFATECKVKYGIELPEDALSWTEVAAENLEAHVMLKEGKLPTAQLPKGVPGAAICEELLASHERYLSGLGAGTSLRAVDGVAATILMLHPIDTEPRVLLDQPEDALFVVPCKDGVIDDLIIGNLEHGALSLNARALIMIGSDSSVLRSTIKAAQARLAMRDEPLAQPTAEAVKALLPAMLRVLNVVTPGCSESELLDVAIEESIREACDEVLRVSPVLGELVKRGLLA